MAMLVKRVERTVNGETRRYYIVDGKRYDSLEKLLRSYFSTRGEFYKKVFDIDIEKARLAGWEPEKNDFCSLGWEKFLRDMSKKRKKRRAKVIRKKETFTLREFFEKEIFKSNYEPKEEEKLEKTKKNMLITRVQEFKNGKKIREYFKVNRSKYDTLRELLWAHFATQGDFYREVFNVDIEDAYLAGWSPNTTDFVDSGWAKFLMDRGRIEVTHEEKDMTLRELFEKEIFRDPEIYWES
jgi:hypothetical protein